MYQGRADGVLNPSGVRFGSADIYSVIDAHFPEQVADSICVGQRRPQDTDERVILFLLVKPGRTFTRDLAREIKAAIREERSPRHVLTSTFETPEIPVSRELRTTQFSDCNEIRICELTRMLPYHSKCEKCRTPGQADRLRRGHQAIWNLGESAEPTILLSIRGRRKSCCKAQGKALIEISQQDRI